MFDSPGKFWWKGHRGNHIWAATCWKRRICNILQHKRSNDNPSDACTWLGASFASILCTYGSKNLPSLCHWGCFLPTIPHVHVVSVSIIEPFSSSSYMSSFHWVTSPTKMLRLLSKSLCLLFTEQIWKWLDLVFTRSISSEVTLSNFDGTLLCLYIDCCLFRVMISILGSP